MYLVSMVEVRNNVKKQHIFAMSRRRDVTIKLYWCIHRNGKNNMFRSTFQIGYAYFLFTCIFNFTNMQKHKNDKNATMSVFT